MSTLPSAPLANAAPTSFILPTFALQVEEALSEEARERTAVGDLKEQLQQLQQQVQEAQERLKLTQARVEQNLQRVNELKAEAVSTASSTVYPLQFTAAGIGAVEV